MNEAEVKIHDVAFGGSGVGKLPDGKVVFVPRTLTGETVRVKLGKSRKGFSEAELLGIVSPSPHRVPPPCAYFGACGGCQYQHASYDEQVRIKEKQVRDTLARIGGFKELPPSHFEGAPSPFGYRNKISIHRGEGSELGFIATDHRTVVDVEKCLIANDSVNAKLITLRKSSYRAPHVTLSDSSQREGSPEGSFHQVNSAMAARLLEWVRGQIGGATSARLLDLYSGSGFFTLGLADLFSGVLGVDYDARAIHEATVNAQKRGVAPAKFLAADVGERIDPLLEDTSLAGGVILIDPPREGLPPAVTTALSAKGSERLIYISCNPATLARDLKGLAGTGSGRYSFKALGIFDMFPQTAHIEAVAVLQRK